MDKKFMALSASLLVVCLIILAWQIFLPYSSDQESEESSALMGNASYVERFFQKDKVIDIEITLDEEDYEDMLQNPMAEEYKVADVVVDGVEVENVGFRVKGNSSLRSVANSDSERYSFKIDFDQYISSQSLEGLTMLNLNNSFSDPSYMREFLSYELLDEMGVNVPAFSYANVYINGELAGIYLAVEGIQEAFLQRYYGEDFGTLYKPYSGEGQGNDLVYIDDDRDSYSALQEVAGLNNDSDEHLVTMIKMLNQGQDLEKYLDIEGILRYFAVNTVLVNMDSYQGQFAHNYYLYEQDGVFTILPWDYNMSFGGFTQGARDGQDQTTLSIDQPVSGTDLSSRPLLGKLLEVEEYKDLYYQYIEEFINGPFTLENMTTRIEEVAELIRPYLEQDPTKFYSMEQFEEAIANLEDLEEEMQDDSAASANTSSIPGKDTIQGADAPNLLEFIEKRIINVSQQLSGELSTAEDSKLTNENLFAEEAASFSAESEALDGMPDSMAPAEGEMANRMAPAEGEMANRMAPAEGEMPDRMAPAEGEMPNRIVPGEQGMSALPFSMTEWIVLGTLTVVLVLATGLVLRLKTRYKI